MVRLDMSDIEILCIHYNHLMEILDSKCDIDNSISEDFQIAQEAYFKQYNKIKKLLDESK